LNQADNTRNHNNQLDLSYPGDEHRKDHENSHLPLIAAVTDDNYGLIVGPGLWFAFQLLYFPENILYICFW